MSPSAALRRRLLATLGLLPLAVGCEPTSTDSTDDTDPADTEDTDDTDVVDTDVEDTDVEDTDVEDTDDTDVVDTDVEETDDTEVVDTEVVDTDPVETDDTDPSAPLCAADAVAYDAFQARGTLDTSKVYTVCLGVPIDDATCQAAGVGEVNAALQSFLPPLCTYDTATWTPIVTPCLDVGFDVSNLTCGPDAGVPGDCCFSVELVGLAVGRPFMAEGALRTAPVAQRPDWSGAPLSTLPPSPRAAEAWTRIGRAEHASVASFAVFALDLLRLGAPPELVHGAMLAGQDEVRHAERAFGLAQQLGGEAVGPGPLDTSGALARSTVAEILRALILEGCLGETLAAHEAAVTRDLCAEPAVRAVLAEIAEDEGAHAALAWRTLRWLLHTHPELQHEADRAFTEGAQAFAAQAQGALGDEDLLPWGILAGERRAAATRRGLDEVVRPTWKALRAH